MKRHRYRFHPAWVPSLVTVLILPSLLGLGFWQLDRAAEKRQRLAELEKASSASPRTLSLPLPARDELLLQPVRARGQYDGRRQYLLANQVRDGRRGYRVLTPLRLDGSDTAVLIDRGWEPTHQNGTGVPAPPAVPSGRQTVTGVATEGPSVGYRMGEAYVGDGDWPRRVTYLDFEAMDEALPYRLVRLVIERDKEPGDYRERLTGGVSPQRHTGYAVQWFALAGALVVIYIVVNLRRESKMSPDAVDARGSNWPVVALAVLFFGPVILAWVLVAMGWYPQGTTNHGHIVEPPERLEATDWRWADGRTFDPGWFRGRWTLLMVRRGDCGATCQRLLDKIARARLALDKDRTRIELLLAQSEASDTAAEAPARGLVIPQQRLDELLAASPGTGDEQALYMVDNQGLRMLTYPLPLDTEGLVSDLERLLQNADEDVERIQRLRHQQDERP